MASRQKTEPTWNVDGLDFRDSTFGEFPLTFKLEQPIGIPSVSSFGTPITQGALNEMIKKRKWDPLITQLNSAAGSRPAGSQQPSPEEEKLLNTHISVTFSKEILLFLLSQQNCAGIKFYFCVNHEGKDSLVLVGVDSANNDLKCPKTGTIVPVDDSELKPAGTKEETVAAEVGGPKSLKDILSTHGVHESLYNKTLREYFAQNLLSI